MDSLKVWNKETGRRLVTICTFPPSFSPVALGSVVRVDSRVDKVEGKKIFVSGEMRSVDKQTLYAQATGKYR